MRCAACLSRILACCWLVPATASAAVTTFFDPSQVATLVDSGVITDTIISMGYQFTYTRDKLFTGGTGEPIGRQVRVDWPDGVEAQAITTPPPGVVDLKARILLQRADGRPFDLTAFTVELLANTAPGGAAIEIMPQINGEDALADPLLFFVTGFNGQTFSFDEAPNPAGSTALLQGYDSYDISLFVDFAVVALTLRSDGVPGDLNGDGTVDLTDLGMLLADFGCTGTCAGDVDGDGDTDLSDLGILLSNFN